MTAAWLLPAFGYVVTTGMIGVTTKLALRHVEWTDILLWAAIVYGVAGLALVATGHRTTVQLDAGTGWAVATGLCAVLGLVFAFLALRDADAAVAVPVMSVYPLVTILVAVAFLGESFSAVRAAGAALVIAGVALLAR